MTPLFIVHTESSLGWGGQEIRILSEAQGLIARGHDVRLLCPPQARIFSEAPAWGIPVTALPIAKKRPAGIRALARCFKDQRPGVVSTHSSTDSWLAALALATLGRPFPMIRTRHISAPVARNSLSRWLYTSATTCIVTTGEALRHELVTKNGFPAERIESIPTGIDSVKFRPGDRVQARTQLKLPQDRKLVGIVATLRSWKGHRFLVEAVAALPEGTGLVIVGDGPQRDALEALVDQHHMRHRVWFAGNQADVPPWLHALDVFALPSYANEGVPQALIQAMLAGLPCVTTHVGSIAELATDGATALVVPPQDAFALGVAIKKLLEDEALGRRLGEQARRHCVVRYSRDTMLDRMEAIYRQASGQR